MADVLDALDTFLRDQRNAVSKEEDKARLERLEEKIDALAAGEPKKSRREILEDIAADDTFLSALEAELAAEADALPEDETEETEEEEEEETEEEEQQTSGIRFRRVELEVPRIYSGDDEPEHVEYIDEDGKVKVRAGRRRGQPVSEEWEEIDNDDEEETEDDE